MRVRELVDVIAAFLVLHQWQQLGYKWQFPNKVDLNNCCHLLILIETNSRRGLEDAAVPKAINLLQTVSAEALNLTASLDITENTTRKT